MSRARFLAAALAECGITLVLLLATVGRDSLWQDEGATWDATGRSLGDTLDMIRTEETNGSLLHLLLRLLRGAFGDAEWVFRVPSVVAAVALVGAVVALGNALFGRRVALLAGAVTAVHGSTIHFGRDGRTYALYALLFTLSLLGLVLDRSDPGRGRFALWVLAGGLTFYVHVYAAVLLLVQAVVLLPRWFGHPDQRRRRLAGLALMGLVMAPLLAVIAARGDLEGLGFKPIGVGTARDTASILVGGGWVVIVPGLAAGAWAAVEVLRRRGSPDGDTGDLRLLLALAAVPTILSFAASIPERIFEPRYLLPSMVPLLLLVCWLVAERAHLARPAVAVLLVLATVGGATRLVQRNEDWRGLTRTLAAEARPRDAVVFLDELQVLVVEYYFDRLGYEPPEPTSLDAVLPAVEWGSFHIADWDDPPVDEEAFDCAVAGRERIWIVELIGTDLEGRFRMLALAEDRFGPGDIRFTDDQVRLRLFTAPGGAPVPAGCRPP